MSSLQTLGETAGSFGGLGASVRRGSGGDYFGTATCFGLNENLSKIVLHSKTLTKT